MTGDPVNGTPGVAKFCACSRADRQWAGHRPSVTAEERHLRLFQPAELGRRGPAGSVSLRTESHLQDHPPAAAAEAHAVTAKQPEGEQNHPNLSSGEQSLRQTQICPFCS